MARELRAEGFLAIALVNKYTLSMASVADEVEICQSEALKARFRANS